MDQRTRGFVDTASAYVEAELIVLEDLREENKEPSMAGTPASSLATGKYD